jgi:hypothetical protein
MERLHKVSAGFIFAFICLHFANHLIGLEGTGAHQQFLEAARLIYRHPVVEMVLLLAFVIQMITGVALSRTIWSQKKDIIHQLQAASGTYMAVFIVVHVAWVFLGRLVLNLDTNFDYAAVTMMTPGWSWVFMPLYGLAIVALFTHLGCITYDIFKKTDKRLGVACLVAVQGVGLYVTYLLLMMYSGRLYPVTLPDPYTDVFGHPVTAVSAPAAPEEEKPAKDEPAPEKTDDKPAPAGQ